MGDGRRVALSVGSLALLAALTLVGCSTQTDHVLSLDQPKGFTPIFPNTQQVVDWESAGDRVAEAFALYGTTLVPKGTRVTVLEKVDRSGRRLGRAFFVRVQIQEGEHVGKSGWVNGFWLHPTIP
jgi:hypothetical protein